MSSNTGELPAISWSPPSVARSTDAGKRKNTMRLDAIAAYIAMTITAQVNVAHISTDEKLNVFMFLGAIGGALVGSLLPSEITTKERIRRWLASFITALLCVGVAVKWFGITLGPDEVMFTAGAIGFLAWGSLKYAHRKGPHFIEDRVRAFFGLKPIVRKDEPNDDA